jgi:hypothetical protein
MKLFGYFDKVLRKASQTRAVILYYVVQFEVGCVIWKHAIKDQESRT